MKHTYGQNFWMLCTSMFLFMLSFNLILPELNSFITDLGGADKKGLIISLFTITAGISRPFSGKLSDTIGRRRVMMIGMLVGVTVCMLYPLSISVGFFLFLRLIHGFAAGFNPTGATALVTDLLPVTRRGKGMGIWGTFISLGIGVGQALGSPIRDIIGINGLFIFAGLTSAASGFILFYVKESLVEIQRFNFNHLKITWKDVFEPSVLPSAMVMFLSAISSGIIFVVTPDISGYLNIENKGWFFLFYVISTILVRLFTSGISDRIGRRKTLLIGVSILIISMFLIAISQTVLMYTIAAIVFGFATGISSPTLFAWTADLSNPQRRGVGSGTMFIALELGILTGSLSTLVFYENTRQSVFNTFLFGVIMAVCSSLYLIWHLRKRSSLT
ncbi:MAG: MFS transporter [Bacteroidetes bacterium]|nr:MFS transporter [Bacteroidota bacterium]